VVRNEAFLRDAESLPSIAAAWLDDELSKVSKDLKKLIDKHKRQKSALCDKPGYRWTPN